MPSVASALNGRKASDRLRPFSYQREDNKLPECKYQSAMDTLMEYTLLSISPMFPPVGGKPDHISSQGKEAIFVTHDIYMTSEFHCTTVPILQSLHSFRQMLK